MALIDRVRNICVSPAREWAVIEPENTQPSELVVSYLVPLAAVSAIAGFIGSAVLAAMLPFGGVALGTFGALIGACVAFVMTLIMCFVVAFIINALAPTFGGRQDTTQAFKVAVYSYTPALAAGVLRVIPVLGSLVVFIASLYSLYVLYLGLPVLMKAPTDKAPAYTIVIVIAVFVVGFALFAIAGMFTGLGLLGARMF